MVKLDAVLVACNRYGSELGAMKFGYGGTVTVRYCRQRPEISDAVIRALERQGSSIP